MWNSLSIYYFGTTRFDPLTKLILGLRYDVFLNVLNQVFGITGNENLDLLFIAAISIGIFVFICSKISKCKLSIVKTSKMKWLRAEKLFVRNVNIFILFLVFISELVTLVMYGYTYKIINGFPIISVTERGTK